jgi:hypothetical protein
MEVSGGLLRVFSETKRGGKRGEKVQQAVWPRSVVLLFLILRQAFCDFCFRLPFLSLSSSSGYTC